MKKSLKDIPYIISAVSALISTGYLLSMIYFFNGPEVSIQHVKFSSGVLAGLISVALVFLFGRGKLLFNLIDGLVLLFAAWVYVNYNLISTVDSSTSLLIFIYVLLLYFSTRVFYSKIKYFPWLVLIPVILCGVYESWLGIAQVLGWTQSYHIYHRVTGNFFNPGPYGGFLAIIMAICINLIVRYCNPLFKNPEAATNWIHYKPAHRILYNTGMTAVWVCTASCFVVFFSAMSRAAFLALLLASVTVLVSGRKNIRHLIERVKRQSKLYYVAALLFSVLIAGGYYSYNLKKDSANGRMLMLKVDSKLLVRNPLTGTGYGSYLGKYAEAQAQYFYANPDSRYITVADAPEFAFNQYTRVGTEMGIPAMLIFVSIFLYGVRRGIRKGGLLWPGLTVLAVFSFFSYSFSLLWFVIFAFVALAESASVPIEKTAHISVIARLSGAIAALILFSFGMFFYDTVKEKKEAVSYWEKNRPLYFLNSYENAAQAYAIVYPLMRDNPSFLFEYGRALHFTGDYRTSNKILSEGAEISSDPMFRNVIGNNYRASGVWDQAEEFYIKAYQILPNRIYPLYLLMKLYEEQADTDKMISSCLKILNFDPKVESSATREIKKEASLKLEIQNVRVNK